MKRLSGIAVAVALLSLSAAAAMAATSGTSNVTLAATANSQIQIVDAAVTLTPTSTDYDNGFVQITGASALRVNVKTNSAGGVVLKVKCADAAPQIALADLLVRTQTLPGVGGASMAAFTAITAADQNLWSTGVSQHAWFEVDTDIRVNNLSNYDDPLGGGTTSYTNTLTYTVVSQ